MSITESDEITSTAAATADCGPVHLHCGAMSGEDCACGSSAATRCAGFDTDDEEWFAVCDRSGERLISAEA